jgi:hypothetical protein
MDSNSLSLSPTPATAAVELQPPASAPATTSTPATAPVPTVDVSKLPKPSSSSSSSSSTVSLPPPPEVDFVEFNIDQPTRTYYSLDPIENLQIRILLRPEPDEFSTDTKPSNVKALELQMKQKKKKALK